MSGTRFDEEKVALIVHIVADGVRQLLENDDHPNGGEHAFDDVGGKVVGDRSGLGNTQQDLHNAGQDHGQQERLVRAQAADGHQHDGGQAGGRSGYAELGIAQQADHNTPDDPRNNAGKERRAAGQGNAETQGKGDQKNDNAGKDVRFKCC